MFTDKTITCQHCRQSFVFTAFQQEFFEQKGYTKQMSLCKSCRAKIKKDPLLMDKAVLHPASCSDCGRPVVVKFIPGKEQLIYCKTCYEKLLRRGRKDALNT